MKGFRPGEARRGFNPAHLVLHMYINSHCIETRVCLSKLGKLGYKQEKIDKHTQMERRLA